MSGSSGLAALLRRYFLSRRIVLVSALLITVIASADLFCPFLAMHALNRLIDWHGAGGGGALAYRAVAGFALGILVLAAGQFGARYVMARLHNATIHRGCARLRTELYAALQQDRAVVAQDRRVGDALSRLVHDVQAMQDAVLEILGAAPYDLTRIVGVLTMMVVLNRVFGLTIVSFLVLAGVAAVLVARLGWQGERRTLDQLGNLNAQFQESLSAGKMLQAMNAVPGETMAIGHAVAGYAEVQGRLARVQSLVGPFFGFTEYAGLVLVLALGGWLTVHDGLSVGALVAFLAYMQILSEPLTRVGSMLPSLQRSSAAARRLEQVLRDPAPLAVPGAALPGPAAPACGAIAFRDVAFSYPHGAQAVLAGLTFQVEAGARVAVIGRNGAGKSTLFDLLLKLQEPSHGSILIDGQDLAAIPTAAWRVTVGTMPQEVTLLNRSVTDNIRLGGDPAGDAVLAARQAGLEEMVLAMPRQFDTVIGERGILLSGGFRQRLAIARLLMRNPRILLFDEPTAALDAEAESSLVPVIDALCRGRTTFIISHRLPLLEQADLVVLLEQGRMRDCGTPGEIWQAHASARDLFPPSWSREAACI